MFQVFILCSGVAALTNLLVGHLLYGVLGMDGSFSYPLAVALAFLSGMVVSFVLNRKFTFAASGRSVFQELRDFTFVSAGGLAITTGLAFVLREYMSSGLVLLTNARVAPENAAHVIAVGLTAIYSFFQLDCPRRLRGEKEDDRESAADSALGLAPGQKRRGHQRRADSYLSGIAQGAAGEGLIRR